MTGLAGLLRWPSSAAASPGASPGAGRDAPRPLPSAASTRTMAQTWQDWCAHDPIAAGRWDHLAQFASTPNPFFERWYLQPALEALDPRHRVKLVRFERGGELIGLLPVERARRYSRWPLPHLARLRGRV